MTLRNLDLSGEGGKRVHLEVTSFHAVGPPDLDLLTVSVEASAGGFSGWTSCELFAVELESFHRSLVAVLEALAGEATIQSIDDYMMLAVIVGEAGHATVNAVISSRSSPRTKLQVSFDTDQSYIRQALLEAT